MQSVGSPFHLFHIIILWAGSLYVVSSMILQMFSMGLKSGEVACQPSLAIKFGKFFCNVWVAFAVWAGAPLLHPERLTSLSLSEKTSFLSGKLSPDALMLTVSLLSQGSDCIQKLRFGLWVACVTIRHAIPHHHCRTLLHFDIFLSVLRYLDWFSSTIGQNRRSSASWFLFEAFSFRPLVRPTFRLVKK